LQKGLQVKNTNGSTSDLLCSAEWHLSRSGVLFAAVIYGFALKISNKTGRFYVSIPRLAEYFAADDRAIRKAIHKLERFGFFVKLKEVPGKSVSYRPVPHDEWARKNPNACLEKLATPWDDEKKDELAIWLHAASDGTMKCFPNFMRGMRNIGHSDEALREHFTAFYASDSKEAKGRFKRFMRYLHSLPEEKSKGASV